MNQNELAAKQKKRRQVITIIVLIIVFILFVIPFLLVLINVFKTKGDITSNPLALIGEHGFTLQNFPEAMAKMDFWHVFKNSAIITFSATILTILFSAMASFVIVRNNWKACTLFFALMIASMVIPFQVLMVPLVSVYGGIFGILGSRITLIFMHVGFSVSMATFMFHGAIHSNIPLELEEAALIDGCSRWQTFWKIVFPLLKPTVATVAIIDAMAFWNDYLLPSLVLDAGVLRNLFHRHRTCYGGAAAGHAADPDPVSLPAKAYRCRCYSRRSQRIGLENGSVF